MEVGIHANMVDQTTATLARALRPLLDELKERLRGDYGGQMEHLWIDLELLQSFARPDGQPSHPFRLQKRVSGRARMGLPAIPDSFNVGHFSVRPDFALLAAMPEQEAIPYVLTLIHETSALLLEKQKRLGGFDAVKFRARFREECAALGYTLVTETTAAI
ncbi:hypothetical protein [Pseudoduganella violacea]|uniref:Uncharacterized protein n=1 Tax=Pseudoduganella violacea TaxID=1715466 RepID=A0A7W5BE62_9BURK|nr:hypothetical protein [Pseudoduganella violacea]MBB3121196.1 hypothetical protein [Pseudoduganella violacea]